MTHFALVRHGETDWNLHGRLQGSSDIPLNDTGRAQAGSAVDELTGRTWDLLVSSPLSRATETADIIGAGLGIRPSATYPDLVERHFGAAEGHTEDEAYFRWGYGAYPGIESRSDVARRGLATLLDLHRAHPAAAVIVVTHGGVIRAVLDVLLDGLRSPRILNAGVSTLTADGDGWRVHSINSVRIDA